MAKEKRNSQERNFKTIGFQTLQILKNLNGLLCLLLFFFLLVQFSVQFSFAQETYDPYTPQVTDQPDSGAVDSGQAVNSSSGTSSEGLPAPTTVTPQQPTDGKTLQRAAFLQNIRETLRASQRDLYDINDIIHDVTGRLEETEEAVTTLREQIVLFDRKIRETEKLILNVNVQVAQKENELVLIHEDMEVKKLALENQKQMLREYLKTLYEQESSVANTMGGNKEINVLKLLLSDKPVAEQLQQITYFSILEETGHEIFSKLEQLMTELEAQEREVNEKKKKLAALYQRLDEEKQSLDIQKKAKKKLLEQTRGEEKIYQQLLEESRSQQEQIQRDMKTLRDNMLFIESKMLEMGDSFNPDDFKSMFTGEKVSVFEYINSTKNDDLVRLRWPVSPSRGISAYFRDTSYVRAFGVQHNAVDIRVPQGTGIRAPADGVVYKVRDNGFGYSYVILAHAGGLMTVYGHVSEFRVEAGEKVVTGQLIALTGGTPGTKGAGVMTTGAHLHFEVMKGGSYTDPLDYLPISLLPIDTLPEKYKSRATGEEALFGEQLPSATIPEDEPFFKDNEEFTRHVEQTGELEESFQHSHLHPDE